MTAYELSEWPDSFAHNGICQVPEPRKYWGKRQSKSRSFSPGN